MKESLVSIGIPAYKKEFLAQAIDSVLKQTYQNIELIIVNDKSPQDLASVVNSFHNDRIHYYVNEQNLGKDDPVKNWNKCLSYAHGEFFSLLCDDDYYEPTFIEAMLSLAECYKDVNVFRSRVKIVDSNNEINSLYPSSPEFETMSNYILDKVSGFRKQTISEFMYRRDYLVKHKGYISLPKAWCSDELSCFSLAKEGGIASVNKPLTAFRMSGINISDSGDKYIIEKIVAEHRMNEILQDLIKGENPVFVTLIKKARKHQYRNKMIYYLSNSSMRDFLHIWKERDKFGIDKACFVKAMFYFKMLKLMGYKRK